MKFRKWYRLICRFYADLSRSAGLKQLRAAYTRANLFASGILLVIITLPAWFVLLNNLNPSMHDDQHIARLFLLDQGIKQGYLFPRWVDLLGFGFGYPLFNFYPPFIYYFAEAFHLIGFSLIWSIKLMIISGFVLAAGGIYVFVKNILGRLSAFLAATLYTYFFYHAITVYIRGALAEFFSFATFAWMMVFLQRVENKPNLENALLLGIGFAVLILTHPLIAFPSGFFIGAYILFCFIKSNQKIIYLRSVVFGLTLGLSLSAFFWLPSMLERKYTLVDKVLTNELADYKKHFVYSDQLWYSPWGFGGSTSNHADGMTFQLGKIHISLALVTLMVFLFLFINKKIKSKNNRHFLLYGFLLFFSLFMTTNYSQFIWEEIQYLSYMQFPWRFLTFSAFFISVVGAFAVFFLKKFNKNKHWQIFINVGITIIIIITVIKYLPYFKPQHLLRTSDAERTTFEEIAWRISNTSFEFVPKGVPLKKSALNTTIYNIEKKDLPKNPYQVMSGIGDVTMTENRFQNKTFEVNAKTPITLRLNTYYFPGWKAAYVDGKEVKINDNNPYKLITIDLPVGKSNIKFIFANTYVQEIANGVTIFSLLLSAFLILINYSLSKKRQNNKKLQNKSKSE